MASFPPRCFTCGKVIVWEKYERMCKQYSPDESLDRLGFRRFCCRRMFLSHVPLLDDVYLLYPAKKDDEPSASWRDIY
jgi:DNA-directed RNA polymerase subunit N (RpoN/RPB10)